MKNVHFVVIQIWNVSNSAEQSNALEQMLGDCQDMVKNQKH